MNKPTYAMLLNVDEKKMTLYTFHALLGRLMDYVSNTKFYHVVWPWPTEEEYNKTMRQLQNLTQKIGPVPHQDDSFATYLEKLHTKFVEYVQEFVNIKNRLKHLWEQAKKNYATYQNETWGQNTVTNKSTQTFMETESSLREQYNKTKEDIKSFFPLDEDDLKKILFIVFQLQRVLRWGRVIENVTRTAQTSYYDKCGMRGFCKNVAKNSWFCKVCGGIGASRLYSPHYENMDGYDIRRRMHSINFRPGRWLGELTNGVKNTKADVARVFKGVYTGVTYRCAERPHYFMSCKTPAMQNSPFCRFHHLLRVCGTSMTRENYELMVMCESHIPPELALTVASYLNPVYL